MEILFVMDPLEVLILETETSLLLVGEAGRRGHRCAVAHLKDLYLVDRTARTRARSIAADEGSRPHARLGSEEDRPLNSFDVVMMRKDPPVDLDYLNALLILEPAAEKVPVINDPAGLRRSNEKLLPLEVPGAAAPSVVTADPAVVAEFVREHDDVVVKPLNEFSGRGIVRYSTRDSDLDAESVGGLATHEGKHVLVQRFLPEVELGDKRVLVVAGEPVGWVNRLPRAGSFRANIHQGARVEATSLTDRERELIEAFGPLLAARGLELAGFDFIGGYVTEINVTSPSALRQINQVMGERLERRMMDWLEARAAEGVRLGIAALVGLSLACGGNGPLSPPPSDDLDDDGLADLEEQALLRQYMPVWDFDETETLFPISLEEWASLGERVMAASGSGSAPYSDPASLLSAVQAFPGGFMVTREEPYPGLPPCGSGPQCNDAPVFVDAVPVDFSLNGRSNLVWLQYWLFYHYDLKQALPGSEQRPQHHGDWEHVCVLVSLDDLADPSAPPVSLHFHAHGGLVVSEAASAWHADGSGSFHPRVYVEAGGHASYRDAGETLLGPHFGGRIDPDGLSHPLVFLQPHATNRSDPVDEIARVFRGRWGQTLGETGESPIGPLDFNQPCDHDYDRSPRLADWIPACSQ